MRRFTKALVLASALVGLAGCGQGARGAADAAADEQAIRAINPAWFKAYNARDVDGIVALYADDAVLNAPGIPVARGSAAIREVFVKDVAAATAAGITFNPGASPEFGVSGDLGWEWNTFTITDTAGATLDAGKYVTVYGRKDGKWHIIRDIWNSDLPPAPAK